MSAATVVPAPLPGVYPGTAMGVYHQWDAASNSRLSRLMRSPAHLRAYIEQPPTKESEALLLGRAIHCAVLEPDRFADSFTVAGQCVATTKAGKRCTNPGVWVHRDLGWVCGVHIRGHEAEIDQVAAAILSTEHHTICLGIRDSVARSRAAHGLISGPGQVELSMVWEDSGTGVTCKGRWDRHSPEIAGGAIVDVKSTRDAHPRSFERAILDLGYHRQAGLYLMGARARRLPARHFSIIAVEKEPPYAVAVYRITEAVVDAAADQIRALLRLYAECMATESSEWRGYPDEVRDISIPDWAWRVMDAETEEISERSAA